MSFRNISMSAALLAAFSASFAFASDGYGQSRHAKYPGAVFVMTNNADQNQILRFGRKADGSLVALGGTSTYGRGSGGTVDPLGSQNSLLLTPDASILLATNSGSGTVSAFAVEGTDLELQSVVSSGGSAPNALAQWGNLVYVLNVAGNSNVVGFHLLGGRLTRIPGAIGYLSTSISGGSSVNFSRDGKFLIATERVTGKIDVFPVNADGTLGKPVTTTDPKAGLFDLAIAPNGIAVSLEPGSGVISSFLINPDGSLGFIGSAVDNDGGTCWNVFTPNGKYMYTADTAGDTISGFTLSGTGALAPINATNLAAKLPAGTKALDLAVSSDGKYLYSTNGGNGTVGIWTINSDGTLSGQSFVMLGSSFAAAGLNGIAAY